MRITETITIDRPAADVWAVIADLESHPRWRPAVREFRRLSEEPLQVGTRIREVLSWRGRELVLDDVVTALEQERELGIHGGWKAATFDLELRLEPTAAGTTVTFDWTLQPRSVLMRLAAPFLRGTMRRSTAEELEGLKAYVEGPPPSG